MSPGKPSVHPPEVRERAVALWQQGMPRPQIAKELNVSSSTIHYWTHPDPAHRRALAAKASRKWRTENKDSFNKKMTAYQRRRRKRDSVYKLVTSLRVRTRSVLKGLKKSASTENYLGCPFDQLADKWNKEYGVDWHARTDLHIDHVRPCASFDLKDVGQQFVCFNWRNLQLLSASENSKKKDTWTEKTEAEWVGRMRSLGYEGELYPVFEAWE